MADNFMSEACFEVGFIQYEGKGNLEASSFVSSRTWPIGCFCGVDFACILEIAITVDSLSNFIIGCLRTENVGYLFCHAKLFSVGRSLVAR